MKLKDLILKRAREYMAKNPGVDAAKAMDAVMAAEAGSNYSQEERAATAGALLDQLATEHIDKHPELKGDYVAAFDAISKEHPDLASRYVVQQNPRVFADCARATEQKSFAATSEEVDQAALAYQARHTGTEYQAAVDAVLASDPDLRHRYERRL